MHYIPNTLNIYVLNEHGNISKEIYEQGNIYIIYVKNEQGIPQIIHLLAFWL